MTDKISPVSIIIKNVTSGERTITFHQDIITIGRAPVCDVVLRDTTRNISGRHAVILKVGSGYILKDTSRNGTRRSNGSVMSNGMSVSLADGDEFEIIGYKIVFLTSERKIENAAQLEPMAPSKDINSLLKDIVSPMPQRGRAQVHHLPTESVDFEKLPHFLEKDPVPKTDQFFMDPLAHGAVDQEELVPNSPSVEAVAQEALLTGDNPDLAVEGLIAPLPPQQGGVLSGERHAEPVQGSSSSLVGGGLTKSGIKTLTYHADLDDTSETMRCVATVCLTLHSLLENKDDSAKGPGFSVLHSFLRGDAINGQELVKAIQTSCDEIVRVERSRQSVVLGAFRSALALVRPGSVKSRATGVMGGRLFRSKKSMLWDFYEKQDSELSAVAEQEFMRCLQPEDAVAEAGPAKRTPLLRRVVGVLLPLALLGSLSGCGAPSPTRLNLTIVTTPQVNPNSLGRPSPVVVRIFDLANEDEFQTSSFDALYRNSSKDAGASILGTEEYEIAPASTRHIVLTLPDGTKSFGMIAAFRQIDHATWRLIVPLRLHRKNKINVIVGPSTVLLKPKH
ncbi:MAG: type VI secretion system lipoprotein TssJ [Acetobacter sp.]